MTPVFIYTLNDPVTGIVRYCGQTTDPDTRLSRHVSNARKEKYHCPCWVKSLLLKKLRPIMEILDVVPDNEADFWEREYIQNFRERGFDLTNGTAGGQARPMLGKKHTAETRAKIGAAQLGRNFSIEHRSNLSIAAKNLAAESSRVGNKNHFFGKKHSSKAIEKMRVAALSRESKKRQ